MHPHSYVNPGQGRHRWEKPGERRGPFPDPSAAITRVIVRDLEGIFKHTPKPVSCNLFIKKMCVELHVVGWGLRGDGSEPRVSPLVSR